MIDVPTEAGETGGSTQFRDISIQSIEVLGELQDAVPEGLPYPGATIGFHVGVERGGGLRWHRHCVQLDLILIQGKLIDFTRGPFTVHHCLTAYFLTSASLPLRLPHHCR